MSTLIEKKAEYEQKLANLRQTRANEIAIKVNAYRESLESEPIPGTEQLESLIKALDEVIEYERFQGQCTASVSECQEQSCIQDTAQADNFADCAGQTYEVPAVAVEKCHEQVNNRSFNDVAFPNRK